MIFKDCDYIFKVKNESVGNVLVRNTPVLGTACRVLKNVTVKQSPRVHRVTFVQCAKLKHEKMIDEICTNPPEKSRLIVIRPMQNVSGKMKIL